MHEDTAAIVKAIQDGNTKIVEAIERVGRDIKSAVDSISTDIGLHAFDASTLEELLESIRDGIDRFSPPPAKPPKKRTAHKGAR